MLLAPSFLGFISCIYIKLRFLFGPFHRRTSHFGGVCHFPVGSATLCPLCWTSLSAAAAAADLFGLPANTRQSSSHLFSANLACEGFCRGLVDTGPTRPRHVSPPWTEHRRTLPRKNTPVFFFGISQRKTQSHESLFSPSSPIPPPPQSHMQTHSVDQSAWIELMALELFSCWLRRRQICWVIGELCSAVSLCGPAIRAVNRCPELLSPHLPPCTPLWPATAPLPGWSRCHWKAW